MSCELTPQDLQITDSRYGLTLGLRLCTDCGFVFADEDEVAGLVGLYEQLEDPAYQNGLENRALQMRWLLDIARKAHPEARTALDVGAGIGLLVKEAQRAGLEATGIEPSRSLVEAAERVLGVHLVRGVFPDSSVTGRKFDLIFLIDVIEHVADPVGLLRAATEALARDGVVVIVTPDVRSVAARLVGHRWWHFRLAHVCYFSKDTMLRAASAAGLEVVGRRRAVWFFPVHYIARRLERYLPLTWLNDRLLRSYGTLMDRVISLNLFDSWLFLMQSRK